MSGRREVTESDEPTFQAVAIIGMAGRFPGAPNLRAFWDNLCRGVEAIRVVSDEQLLERGATKEEIGRPHYVKACAELADIDKFDAAYFGIHAREATVMDPAHRFFLEVAHHALEDAGYAGDERRVGVFASSGASLYAQQNVRSHPELIRTLGEFLIRHSGNDMNFLATRVSYELDLCGPSLNVQTACSSSLVAVHLACESLARGECELALAGGSTILLPMGLGYEYAEGEILSPDGHCRPFAADSAGTVFGSGTGCVVLKLLERALDDGDTIYAVVRGTAVNNDGAPKAGYLAPGVDGQASAVVAALRASGVDARSISYVEAHGTGTRIGDPIEVAALCHAFREFTEERGYCALGSLKSNIGHLGEAAGVASLIKATLSLRAQTLPPTLGITRPNPELALESSPFKLQQTLTPWARSDEKPLRCGVTALGAGGTNCHIILEEAPPPLPSEGARPVQLLMLSAKTPDALARLAALLADQLEHAAAPALADVAYTLAVGRRQLRHRLVVLVHDRVEAQQRLRDPELVESASSALEPPPQVIFVFPARGEVSSSVTSELYTSEPTFRAALDRCFELVADEPLRERLRSHLLHESSAPQPAPAALALFAFEYALAQLFLGWGVSADALFGEQVGACVAACLAEVLSLEHALALVQRQSQLSTEGELELHCSEVAWRAPKLPLLCAVTRLPLSAESACSPAYWAGVLAARASSDAPLFGAERALLLELAPRPDAAPLAAQLGAAAPAIVAVPEGEISALEGPLRAYGRLWMLGAQLDRAGLYDGQLRGRVPLPGYPFAATSHWLARNQLEPPQAGGALAAQQPLDAWFWRVGFREQPLMLRPSPARRWLVIAESASIAELVARSLPGERRQVSPGRRARALSRVSYELDVGRADAYEELCALLHDDGFVPEHVVYALAASGSRRGQAGSSSRTRRELELSVLGLNDLARALGRLGEPVELSVLTYGLTDVAGAKLRPLASTALGPVLVTPREYGNVRTRLIDLPTPLSARSSERIRARLEQELLAASPERTVALRESGRWLLSVSPVHLPEPVEPAAWLWPAGCYFVTGGLGGIALEVCLHMARSQRVKLALLSRSEFPSEAEWPARALAAGTSSVGDRLRKLLALRELGAEVMVVQGDVADERSLRRALRQVRSRFGPLHGVIHAAGVLDDELIETRGHRAMERVLAPKVQGTLLLDQLIREPLDWFLIFSSVASLLGLPGQVDYTAANAFLDAFANERAQRDRGVTRVINWNAWREVGMTASALRRAVEGFELMQGALHPALDGYFRDHDGRLVFVTRFCVQSHWLLAEHRIRGGSALLSGTSFVELARAAAHEAGLKGGLELSNLNFLSPFQVNEQEERALVIELLPLGAGFELSMRTLGDERGLPHVLGDVRSCAERAPAIDLSAVRARCTRSHEQPSAGFLEQAFMAFGPRWGNLRALHYGAGEALLELALPSEYADDLTHFLLHPALLDMATGGAQKLIEGADLQRDFYVPLGYERIRLFAAMPRCIWSHVRYSASADRALAYFDVTLCDQDGKVFAEISRFTMKRLDARAFLQGSPASYVDPRARRARAALESLLGTAIDTEQGLKALERIMAQPRLTQVVASSVDIERWQAELAAEANDAAQLPQADQPQRDDYVAPATDGERFLASVWSELLGVARVGVLDDFFELGGSSLLAVRLFSRIKKHYGVALPLSTLFEAANIRELSHLLGDEAESAAEPRYEALPVRLGAPSSPGYSSVVAMQPHGSRAPFYCAAGMGGNPLNLRALAEQLGRDQPFFGLQPRGLDGASLPHRTIFEMAAHYVIELRAKQPNGPYYLGGYSGGGTVAFEMARQLSAAGQEVAALVFLDSPAPELPTRSYLARLALHVERTRRTGGVYLRALATERYKVAAGTVTRLWRHSFASSSAPRGLQFVTQEMASAFRDAYASYRPAPWHGDALLLRAESESPLGTGKIIDEYNGWQEYVRGQLDVVVVPGDHNTMCEEPNVRVLARHLRAYLDRRMELHAAQQGAGADAGAGERDVAE